MTPQSGPPTLFVSDEEDISAILEDSNDGLVIEKIDGIEIIKGGKLTKLVERLAHHSYFGNNWILFNPYLNAFDRSRVPDRFPSYPQFIYK